ncbi:signal transduction histidine kinase [Arcanobacterium pluranimalium]|uniref:GAF domain-containing sensor histidine kinase n=1 Tax=Arcanobacterium pluranimalium TaxID=108028 RepID=UPI00195CA874|nr:GAF domain-containing protein [Arcanobacterium pluranimalium]MBM7825224.1 signal transduction histidine kinase [Arcanobacterium pluranimalium]
MTYCSISDVLLKALELTGKLDRRSALQYFVDTACELTGARYSALGVLDSHGETVEFFQCGLPDRLVGTIGQPPRGHGLFADIPAHGYLKIDDLAEYMHLSGYPHGHPHMRNFLGVIVPVNEQIWGRLYLADKESGFTDEDGKNMELFAQAAAIAVKNSRLYAESQNRARWLTSSQNIVSSLLEGSDEEEALQVIAEQMRIAAKADNALMILPSIQDTWVCEIVAGEGASDFLGVNFPRSGRAQTVIREQAGVVIDSMQRLSVVRVEQLRRFGAALYAPLVSKGIGLGVIILLRKPGQSEFDLHDLSMAENVAKQAAIALELADARHSKELAAELDERARISRDLHDLAIQQLFASGMHITAVKEDLGEKVDSPEISQALDNAIWAIDESVSQIRKIVQSLRDDSSPAALVDRLQHETSVALQSLGFAPSLLITWHGETIGEDFDVTRIDNAVGSDVSDDVVAVVREGLSNVARHAHASSVSVEVSVTADTIQVSVIDDGVGLAPSLSRRSGLSNLAARARRHHGDFEIGPDPQTGKLKMCWQASLR